MNIQGIVLAGGQGTRLRPLTNDIPKPLLPIGSKPMISYPLEMLAKVGITEITVVRKPEYRELFERSLKKVTPSDVHITYVDHQKEPYGMPYAIGLGEATVQKGNAVCSTCGDVLCEGEIQPLIDKFLEDPSQAVILATPVPNTAGFSPIVHTDGQVQEILEKDNMRNIPGIIDLGTAIYPYDVFEKIKTLYPSEQEVPLTALNKLYLAEGCLRVVAIEGWWSDVGKSIEEYYEINKRYEQQE